MMKNILLLTMLTVSVLLNGCGEKGSNSNAEKGIGRFFFVASNFGGKTFKDALMHFVTSPIVHVKQKKNTMWYL